MPPGNDSPSRSGFPGAHGFVHRGYTTNSDELKTTMNDLQPAIEAQGLGRRFGRYWALAHVELAVPQGETLLLAGPNGSGKTTLLRIIAGLYRPTRGGLRVFGLDPCKDRPNCRRQLSMVSHDFYLYPRLTALETLRIWARLLGRPSADGDLVPLLEEVDLAERRDTPVVGFSTPWESSLAVSGRLRPDRVPAKLSLCRSSRSKPSKMTSANTSGASTGAK